MEDSNALVIKHAHQLERIEKELDHNKGAHEKIYERLSALEKGSTTTEIQYTQIISTLAEMKADIVALKEKPAKRWEAVVGSILGVIGGAVGALIVSNLLSGG